MNGDAGGAFQPIGRYAWPATPTEDAIKRFVKPILRRLRDGDDAPHMAKDRLERASPALGAAVAPPPPCSGLLRELGATLDAWARGGAGADSLRLVVMPPCEESGLLEHWARANGHRLVAAPPRDAASLERRMIEQPHSPASPLADPLATPAPGDAVRVSVIPRLEHWFLRHRNGLQRVRALLAALDASKRQWVVGCNSWAWRYLQKAVAADAILPQGLGFRAFDAARLRAWFAELGDDDPDGRPLSFRLAASGAVVLRVPPGGEPRVDEDAADEHFRVLAAHSFGIPWVAWRTWHESLRARIDAEDGAGPNGGAGPKDDRGPQDGAAGNERTVWIAGRDEFVLPPGREADALLVLHALLLHDSLGIDALRAVLPSTQAIATLPALLSAGFVARDEQGLRCRALAYPSIRRALVTAGYPSDRL